jgi:hypothetical protein
VIHHLYLEMVGWQNKLPAAGASQSGLHNLLCQPTFTMHDDACVRSHASSANQRTNALPSLPALIAVFGGKVYLILQREKWQ